MRAAISGVGMAPFGRHTDVRLEDLAWRAIEPALMTAGVEPEHVDAVFVGTVFGRVGVASRVARAAGLTGAPALAVEAACASGTVAVQMAKDAVESGRARCAVAIGLEQMTNVVSSAIPPEPTDVEGRAGLVMPAMYALSARWYLDHHRVDPVDMARVAVKNLSNAADNPRSLQRPARSLDEVVQSRMIADPLTVLQCCPVSDGAAAVVVTPERGESDEVVITAAAVAGGRAWPGEVAEPWGPACVRRARDLVEKDLGSRLDTADVVEVHDAFTIGELLTIEAMGLAPDGIAPALLRDGEFGRDGRLPVNPSGGLIGRGHPLGATGVAQTVETWLQLRGAAGDVQIAGAQRGVVETMGGGASGLDGNVAAILVLDRT